MTAVRTGAPAPSAASLGRSAVTDDLFRALVENSADGIALFGADATILYASPSTIRILGYSSDELLGRDALGLVHPEDATLARQRLRECLARPGEVVTIECRFRHKDGSWRALQGSGVNRLDEPTIGALVVNYRDVTGQRMRDVTEIRRAREALRQSERHLRAVFDGATDAMVVTDDHRVYLDVNPASCRLHGRPKRELLGRPIDAFLAPSADIGALWQGLLHEGRALGEIRITRPDGSTREVECAATADIVAGRHLGVLRDITERKRHEDTLHRLASIVESSDDAIIAKTMDGTIESWNAGATRLYLYAPEEVIGRPIAVIVPQERQPELEILWQRLERGEHIAHYETVRVRKDGVRVPVSLSVSPIKDAEGRVIGASSIARDMTERKRFERALQEKNLELERASLAKDRFLASMSHELRTPLNAILGFTGTLLMRLPGDLTAEQERQLRTVQMSARHLLSLINELLDVAKIESGKLELHPEPLVCQEVVGEVVAALSPLADERGLRLDADLPPDPIVLRTDRRAVRQILINLTSNAVKFTEAGHVRLSLGTRRRDGEPVVDFRVEDTGPGIRPEDLPRLFHPFQQIVAASAPSREGTGLGLHLSQKLARVLGGEIRVQSRLGEGSAFTLTLGDHA
jgi:protein-histidine pros-kinase